MNDAQAPAISQHHYNQLHQIKSLKNKIPSFNSKTQMVSKILLMLILICLSIKQVKTDSIPLSYESMPHIESRIITVTSIYSYYRTVQVPYLKYKATTPTYDRVFVSVVDMNYNVNTFPSWATNYYLYFSLYFNIYPTYIYLYCYHSDYAMQSIRASILIFDNQFINNNIIDSNYIYFEQSWTESVSVTLQEDTFSVIKFLTYIEMQSQNQNRKNISYSMLSSYSSPNYETQIAFGDSNYQYAYVEVRLLVIYTKRIPSEKMVIDIAQVSFASSTGSIQINHYDSSNSGFILGIQSFVYLAVNDPSNQGFSWNTTLSSSNQAPLLIEFTFDDQFSSINFNVFVLSKISCSKPNYALRGINRTTSVEQCFDVCYQNQYIKYNDTKLYLMCNECSNQLCKTCDQSEQCGECIDNYELDENGDCILSGQYYLDSATGEILICSDNLPGCINCTSDGSTCNLCQSNYYNAGSSCTQCSTIDSNCIRCDSATTCLECLSPKVLLTQTLCGDPLPGPVTPPGPPAPCTDPNCAKCSTTDPNDCLSCTSALFTLENGKCSTKCGDGLIDGEVCDDGNTIDFDGCSSDCKKVEDGFTCDKIPAVLLGYETSDCYFSRPISISVLSIKKPIDQNKVVLILKNSEPKIRDWEQIDADKELTAMFDFKVPRLQASSAQSFFNFTFEFVKSQDKLAQIKKSLLSSSISQVRTLQSQFDPSLYEYIELTVLYSGNSQESLNHQSVSLSLQPALSGSKLFSAVSASLGSTITFDLVSDDNQIIQYFDESYYQYADTIFNLSAFVSILTVIMLIISFISFCVEGKNSKQLLIALEASFIVQFTYFSLSGIGELNPLFIKMAEGLKYSSGFDLFLSGNSNASRELLGIGIQSFNISDNVNVSVALVLICLIAGGVGMLLDKLIFSKKESEKVNSESPRSNQEPQSTEQQSKCLRVSKFLIFNLGFTLFLYFLYKFIFFSAVQLKYGMSSLSGADAIILVVFAAFLVFYLLMLFLKLENFATFTEKIKLRQSKFNVHDIVSRNNELSAAKIGQICQKFQKYVQELSNDQKPEAMWQISSEKSSIKIQFWYILIIFIEHIVNIFVLVLLSHSFIFHGMVPLAIYLFNLVFGCKYKFYTISNMWRLKAFYIFGIVIQIIFLARSILMSKIIEKTGGTQADLGKYFPFTNSFLLLIICFISLIYIVYSIRKFRCCELQIEWQKLQLTQEMKFKLEKLIQEQMRSNYNHLIVKSSLEQKQFLPFQNGLHNHQKGFQNNNLSFSKDQYTSFNSNSEPPFSNLPFSITKPVKNIIAMVKDNDVKSKKVDDKPNQSQNLEISLNQELLAKSLRKQIINKLSAQKISQKIKSFGEHKLQNMEALKLIQEEELKIKKKNASSSKIDMDIKQKNKNSKGIFQSFENVSNAEQRNRSHDENQKMQNTNLPFGYIYTDSKVYDTYQQFDMI